MDFLIRIAFMLAANAIALLVAAILLDRFRISELAFPVVVVIYTVVLLIVRWVTAQLVNRHASQISAGIGLIATYITLLITDLVSDSLQIEGVITWVLATLIVWLAWLVTDALLDKWQSNRVRARPA